MFEPGGEQTIPEVANLDRSDAMLIGFMGVSKADAQVLDLQRDALLAAGIDAEHVYEDLASGSLDARLGLDRLPEGIVERLLVWKLDRLGRNFRHLIKWCMT